MGSYTGTTEDVAMGTRGCAWGNLKEPGEFSIDSSCHISDI